MQDGWTDLGHRIRREIMALPPEKRTPANVLAAYEDADHQKMSEIRARAETVVNDPEAGQKLKAWYRQLCKRPCFHDEYLDAYNQPGTRLIDTDGRGVERITENGVVAGGVEYPVDCIIYASGFEVGTEYSSRAGFQVTGRDGETLTDHWEGGMRTFHGLQMHGFPNAFMVQPTQAANLIANVPHNIVDHADTIAAVVAETERRGAATVEPTAEAEGAWVDLLLSGLGPSLGNLGCTPGYYNNEGEGFGDAAKYAVGHPAGALGYFSHIDALAEIGRVRRAGVRLDTLPAPAYRKPIPGELASASAVADCGSK